MPYAQRDYRKNLQGRVSPRGAVPKYPISQIGCFLTSFSNLMERFGKSVDPVTLNNKFRDAGIYRDVDDGIFDDLSYDAVQRLNGNIVVTATGVGAPPHSNAIVKFTNLNTTWKTHFSLVADASRGLIVDSYDGKVKSWNAYGGPKTWATYEDRTPPPPPPPPAPTPPPAPVAAPAPQSETVQIKAQKGWGISYLLKAAGYNQDQFSSPDEWLRFSALNGATGGQNIRVVPGKTYSVYRSPMVLPVATPTPVAPPEPVPAPTPQPTPAPAPAPVVVEPPATPAPEPVVEKVETPAPVTEQTVEVRVESTTTTAPENYVGPLKTPDDDLFDLSVAKEARIALNSLSPREKLVDLLARLFGFVAKIKLKVTK